MPPMSSAEFGWQSLLNTDAAPACALKAGLFTTYDRADERLLAEHLLPLLLKLSREPDGEGVERQYFLLDLDRRLKQLHDHLVVVSSTAREEPGDAEEGESGTYAWIWRCIRHLTVGSGGKAVQHAKLWLLHWGPADADGAEHLEIVVSSANLTRAAFKGQMQAAWRACIELRQKRSEARLNGWGVLPEFLQELAAQAGDETRLATFVELLARADCPQGVSFVASVPGTHSRQTLRRTPWGAAGLQEISPSGRGTTSVAILCPFVGSWTADALRQWCERFEGAPDRLALVWIDKNHPWARAGKWILPQATLKTLTKLDATLLKLRFDPGDPDETDLFHEEHRAADNRWSHAKVYYFKRGTSRRLLLTSANFSTAAWGRPNDDALTIENFELGVCIEQAVWPFEELTAFDSEEDVATVSKLPVCGSAFITWARASWDGNNVDVNCRCEASRELKGAIKSGTEWTLIPDWTVDTDGRLRKAKVSWSGSIQPPVLVHLTCEQETMSLPIFDERPARDREATIPPEVDENLAQAMRDELLFEQYGGHVATESEDEELTGGNEVPGEDDDVMNVAARSDSYSVPAFVLARRHLGVVDNWADKVKCAAARGTEKFERQVLRRDGELLIAAFQRQAERDDKKGPAWEVGARLAAEELALR
jgi:hypothetical protein